MSTMYPWWQMVVMLLVGFILGASVTLLLASVAFKRAGRPLWSFRIRLIFMDGLNLTDAVGGFLARRITVFVNPLGRDEETRPPEWIGR